MIQRYDSNNRLSHAVVHNGFVFVAGQVADDTSADVQGQTEQVLAKIDALLAKTGSSRSRILSASVWLPDIANFSSFNTVWDAWIPHGEAPARACVESRLANPLLSVEVAVIAAA